jgi:hypothetical protein
VVLAATSASADRFGSDRSRAHGQAEVLER